MRLRHGSSAGLLHELAGLCLKEQRPVCIVAMSLSPQGGWREDQGKENMRETAKTKFVKQRAQERLRKQIRPGGHGKLVGAKDQKTGKYLVDAKSKPVRVEAAILIHPAYMPSELEGRIAPGFIEGSKLNYTVEATEISWDLCGGADGRECQIKVSGDMKPLARSSLTGDWRRPNQLSSPRRPQSWRTGQRSRPPRACGGPACVRRPS